MRTIDRTRTLSVCFLFLSLGGVFARSARSELVIDVGYGDTIGVSSIEMFAGDSLTLDLYITQVDGTDRLNQIGTSINVAEIELGLSGGTGLSFSGRTFGDLFADEGGLTQLTGDRLLFSVGSSKSPDASLGGEIPGVLASEDGVDDNSLRLGDFTLRSAPGVSGTFTVDLVGGSFLGSSSTTTPDTWLNGVPLRSGSLSVQVTAIPEAGVVAGMLAITFAVVVRNRRTSSVRG